MGLFNFLTLVLSISSLYLFHVSTRTVFICGGVNYVVDKLSTH